MVIYVRLNEDGSLDFMSEENFGSAIEITFNESDYPDWYRGLVSGKYSIINNEISLTPVN